LIEFPHVSTAFVIELSASLGERDPGVLIRLGVVVMLIGEQRARLLLDEALAIHARGGLKRSDGGSRTLGGIYFNLAARRAPPVIQHPAAVRINSRNDLVAGLMQIAADASGAAKRVFNSGHSSTCVSAVPLPEIHDLRRVLDQIKLTLDAVEKARAPKQAAGLRPMAGQPLLSKAKDQTDQPKPRHAMPIKSKHNDHSRDSTAAAPKKRSRGSGVGRTCINLDATQDYESIEPHVDDRNRFG
jgi:hypothetical protein